MNVLYSRFSPSQLSAEYPDRHPNKVAITLATLIEDCTQTILEKDANKKRW